MKKLGQQWIEVIDGKMHMLKAVERAEEISHISARVHPCFKCFFQMDDYDCAYPSDKWVCDMQRGVIIKDLGILNEDGCLPSPWGGYPKIIHEVDQDRTENGEDVHYDNLWCVEIHESVLVCTEEYPTKQEAIDAWNRRV